MWIKHHSWRLLLCTHLITLKICVATIAICFLGHPVVMPPVLAAALAFSCSTRCTVPGKHKLQSPPTVMGGHWTAQALLVVSSAAVTALARHKFDTVPTLLFFRHFIRSSHFKNFIASTIFIHTERIGPLYHSI